MSVDLAAHTPKKPLHPDSYSAAIRKGALALSGCLLPAQLRRRSKRKRISPTSADCDPVLNITTRIEAFKAFCRTQDYLNESGLVPLTETQLQHRRILQTFITRIETVKETSKFRDRSFQGARLHALPKGMCQSSLKRDVVVVSKQLQHSGLAALYTRFILGADDFNKLLQAYGIIGANVDNSSIPIELNYKCPGLPVLGEHDASNCYKSTNDEVYNCYVGKDHQDHFDLLHGEESDYEILSCP